MSLDWKITSAIAKIFDPPENPIARFIEITGHSMSSNTVLLKGVTDNVIAAENSLSFFSVLMRDAFTDLFLEFDRAIKRYDYHDWTDAPDSQIDFFAGYKPRFSQMVKPDIYHKLKPMSYLGFWERLHWMLRTAPFFYSDTRPHEKDALQIIQDLTAYIFEQDAQTLENAPQSWIGPPNWIEHSWIFYDVVPDFLYNSGYWEHVEESPENAYFDGGPCDSCTFFFQERTFYILMTNGSP